MKAKSVHISVKNVAEDCAADVRIVLPLEADDENKSQQASDTLASDEENDGEESAINRLEARVRQLQAGKTLQAENLKVMLPAIINQRFSDLQTLNVIGGCSMFYARSLKNAATLRHQLVLYSQNRQKAIIDAHEWLLCKLPTEFLASYLNLLRYLKISASFEAFRRSNYLLLLAGQPSSSPSHRQLQIGRANSQSQRSHSTLRKRARR